MVAMNENENVQIAVESAIESMSKIDAEDLIIDKDDLDKIIRQSFLYQIRDIENRSEITKDIQNIIQSAVDNLDK
jgi:hypothetical protein